MTKFEIMDVKDVLSPALFERAKLGGSITKPVTLKDDRALAFLVKDNPGVAGEAWIENCVSFGSSSENSDAQVKTAKAITIPREIQFSFKQASIYSQTSAQASEDHRK